MATDNPTKLCECGCGEPTSIALETSHNAGRIKGQPMRFVSGHNSKVHSVAFVDITGKRFGRLVVIHRAANLGKLAAWHCQCDCGEQRIVRGGSLRDGKTVSCGCARRDSGRAKKIHGMSHSPTYNVWSSMIQRCYYEKAESYHLYGARGITVCKRWRKFKNFLADMGKQPSGKSIERIDNNGNYGPSNCRWATRVEQANNRRTNRLLTAFGKTQTVAMWAREVGISMWSLHARITKLGWSVEDALIRKKYATNRGSRE